MNRRLLVKVFGGAVLVAAVVSLVQDGIHFVDEAEALIVTQFGDPVGRPVDRPGLAFDLPLAQTEHYFDRRLLKYQSEPTHVPTKDKRYISVSAFALWRISDPLKFLQRVTDEAGAQARLVEIVDGEVRNAVARYDLIELVRTTTRTPDSVAVSTEQETVIFEKLEKGRAGLAAEILARARERAADLGFDIVDFRFKHLSYVEDVQKAVFARMIAERQRIAQLYRAEGQGEAARISGERDRDLSQIRSEAYRTAEERRGKADGEATRIYAEAYGRNPDLYTFVKSLDTYERSFDRNTIMILDGGSDLLKFLSRTR